MLCKQWDERTEIYEDERGNLSWRPLTPPFRWSDTASKAALYKMFIIYSACEGIDRISNRALLVSIEEIREAPGELESAQWSVLDGIERRLMEEDTPQLTLVKPVYSVAPRCKAPESAIEWAVPISEIRQAVCLQAAEYRRGGMGKSTAMREAWKLVKAGAMSRYAVMS